MRHGLLLWKEQQWIDLWHLHRQEQHSRQRRNDQQRQRPQPHVFGQNLDATVPLTAHVMPEVVQVPVHTMVWPAVTLLPIAAIVAVMTAPVAA